MIVTFRNFFFRDFWLKLFSLMLAGLSWWIVWSFAIRKDLSPADLSHPLEDAVFYNVPVLVLSAAEDNRNFKVSPSEVTITVRGEPKTIQDLKNRLRDDPQARDIRALVDLTGIESVVGMQKKITVTTPPDVIFELAEPDQVKIIEPAKH